MAAEIDSKKAFALVLIWIAVDVTTLFCNRLVLICLAKFILMFLFCSESRAAAAAASSTTFPSVASFQDPFSDQKNQSNDNQQISKASVAPVLIWIAIDVTIGSKKATT